MATKTMKAKEKLKNMTPSELSKSVERMIGTIPNTGDSVKEVREIRKKLSKEPFDLEEINKSGE